MNLQNVPQGWLERKGSSQTEDFSTTLPELLSVVASSIEESFCLGTFGVSSIHKLNSSQEASPHGDQAWHGSRISLQEELLDGQNPDTAANPVQSTRAEALTH